jgi:hypothetical protein
MKIRFVNYRKEFPKMGDNVFTDWFYVEKRWSGALVYVGIKHYAVCLDFRDNLVSEMSGA